MKWTVNSIPSQKGRRVLLTGANSGLGFQAALELARKGAEIILPARSRAKAEDAVARIRAQLPDAQLVPAVLDLASLASVREFAAFFAGRFPGESIDLLINNAGVMALPTREVTEDGFERQFATNFLGPFALTALLFPQLKSRAGTRVVCLGSVVVHDARIDFDNLQSERRYGPFTETYSQSKLADVVFALELQRRLSAAKSPIASMAAHPGLSATNLTQNMSWLLRSIAPIVMPLIGQSAAQGALPELYAATAPEAAPGGYYGPDGRKEQRGHPVPARLPPAASDAALARRLWDTAERLTGVEFRI